MIKICEVTRQGLHLDYNIISTSSSTTYKQFTTPMLLAAVCWQCCDTMIKHWLSQWFMSIVSLGLEYDMVPWYSDTVMIWYHIAILSYCIDGRIDINPSHSVTDASVPWTTFYAALMRMVKKLGWHWCQATAQRFWFASRLVTVWAIKGR